MKNEKKKKPSRRTVILILMVFFACSTLFSFYKIITINKDYTESEKSYDDLLQYVEMPSASLNEGAATGTDFETDSMTDEYIPPATNPVDDETDTSAPPESETDPGTDTDIGTETESDTAETEKKPEDTKKPDETKKPSKPKKPVFPKVDFDALSSINKDVKAWIYIEGTNINYPIVQGEDNDHYLHYTFTGEENRVGSIFMDYRCPDDFSGRNTVIYGHRLSNKTMFTALKNYKKQWYYNTYPNYVIVTPDKNYVVKIFAGYVATVKDEAWTVDFASDDEFAAWLKNTKAKSLFKSNVTPKSTDRIVTLSTCTYEFDNARFVLFGVLTEQ